MKTIKNTIAEYKAPKCKVVKVHVQTLVCASPFDNENGTEKLSIDPDEDL